MFLGKCDHGSEKICTVTFTHHFLLNYPNLRPTPAEWLVMGLPFVFIQLCLSLHAQFNVHLLLKSCYSYEIFLVYCFCADDTTLVWPCSFIICIFSLQQNFCSLSFAVYSGYNVVTLLCWFSGQFSENETNEINFREIP